MPRSSISRKKSDAKLKRVRAGATPSWFPGDMPPANHDTPHPAVYDGCESTSKCRQEQRSKSNQLNYLRRKNATITSKLGDAQLQASVGVKRESGLLKETDKQAKLAQKSDDSNAKMMTTLTSSQRKLGLSNKLRKDDKAKAKRAAIEVQSRHSKQLSIIEDHLLIGFLELSAMPVILF